MRRCTMVLRKLRDRKNAWQKSELKITLLMTSGHTRCLIHVAWCVELNSLGLQRGGSSISSSCNGQAYGALRWLFICPLEPRC